MMAIESEVRPTEIRPPDIIINSLGATVTDVKIILPSEQEIQAYEIEGCTIEQTDTPIRLFWIANEPYNASNGYQKILSSLREDLPIEAKTYTGPPINEINPKDLSLQNRPFNNSGLYIDAECVSYPNEQR